MDVHCLKLLGNIKYPFYLKNASSYLLLKILIFEIYLSIFNSCSYRMENIIEEDILAFSNPRKEYFLYKRIIYAVIIHQKALELVFLYYFIFLSFFLLNVQYFFLLFSLFSC